MNRCVLLSARCAAICVLVAVVADPGLASQAAGSAGQTVKYSALVSGGKLPYGKSVTITGTLDDLKCGSEAVSKKLNVTGITASYLGESGTPPTGTVDGQNWTASLGQLPADTAINLQVKITGTIAPALRGVILDKLAASGDFARDIEVFFQMTRNEGTSGVELETERLMQSLGGASGTLTKIVQSELPCVAAVDVTTAATTAFRKNLDSFANLNHADQQDLMAEGSAIRGVTPQTPPSEVYSLLKGLKTDADYQAAGVSGSSHITVARGAAGKYTADYETVMNNLGLTVVSESSVGVILDNPSSTADLNKYAGFDVGVNYVPRINELRQFDMVHVYPFGPVELGAGGLFTKDWKATYSLAAGVSIGDFSGNASSRIKWENAFVYGLGIRINKYFRVAVGGMVYRDAASNRLLNEGFIGPSIDVTALPGLKQIFSSSSGSSTSSKGSGSTSNPSGTTRSQGAQNGTETK